ncbi:MAG: PAS domain-containing protein [Chloroflexota bacterium]
MAQPEDSSAGAQALSAALGNLATADGYLDLLGVVLAASADGIAFLSTELTLRAANPICARQLTLPLAQAIGRPAAEVFPGCAVELTALCRQAAETGAPARLAACVLPTAEAEGGATYWDLTVAPLRAPDGAVAGYLFTQHDVSESVRLRRSEERFRLVVANSPDTVYFQDRDLIYRWIVNPTLILSPENVLGRTHSSLTDPEEVERALAIKRQVLATGARITYETRALDGDQVEWYETTLAPWHDEQGHVVGLSGFVRDITARKRDEAERERLLAELNATIDSVVDGLTVYGPRGEVVRMNAAAQRILGYESKQAPAPVAERMAALRVMTPEGEPRPYDALPLARALRGETVREQVDVLRRPGGARVYVATNAAPVRAGDGTLLGAVVTFRDITAERRQAAERERLLAAVEHQAGELSAIFDTLAEGLTVFNGRGEIELVNPAAERIMGSTLAQYPSTIAERVAAMRPLRADGSALPFEEYPPRLALQGQVTHDKIVGVHDAAGRLIWTSVSAVPIRTAEGGVLGVVTSFSDIGARLEAERQLAAAKTAAESKTKQLRALLESLGEAVVIVDAAGNVVMHNRAAREAGLRIDLELKGAAARLPTPLVRAPDGSALVPEQWPLRRALRGEMFTGVECLYVRPDGVRRRLVVSSSGVRDEAGQLALAIVVYHDVSELRRLEEAREDFVRAVSHDLRQPLTVIQGQAQLLRALLQKRGIEEREHRSLEGLTVSAKRMGNMIADMVEVTRLETGQLLLDCVPLDLYSYALDVAQRLAVGDDAGRVHVEPPPTPPLARADEERLERVLTNLIGNALKYSPGGTPVTVCFQRRGNEVITTVSDLGRGIPAADLPHILERYYRAQAERERRSEGLGLGLYISRLIVEAHGGRLWVESQLCQGSSFYFSLPVA